MNMRRFVVGGLVALVAIIVVAVISSRTCISAYFKYGVSVGQCPSGEVHPLLNINASNLRRGQKGFVTVTADMMYVVGDSASVSSTRIDATDVELSLVRGDDVKKLTLDTKDAPKEDHASIGTVTLPADLKDGDYQLRAKAHTKAGDVSVDAPLPVYAPAKIHVLTDRPLYEPGHTIQFRAVVLRARDLVPLDGRPGRFSVQDPAGVVVLDEKADAGEFGIADGELPLDKSSPPGVWHVRYTSGGAVDDVSVEVKPFELPRFTVEVEPQRPFYRAKDEPRARVHVAYASGVPTRANLDIEWNVSGAWPAPPEWIEQFPKTAKTDAGGRVELTLPKVPADLVGKASITATVSAVDDTGDRQVGQGTLMLAQDAIDVSMVTELGQNGELVAGVNNRAYLRATTAAGEPLAQTTLVVKRAWDRADKGITVDTDEDGVAALQLDPGPAVNIVIPPMPIRLPPPAPMVERTGLTEVLRGDASLADTAAIDRWNPIVGKCARFAGDNPDVAVQVRVLPSGAVARVSASGEAGPCVEAALHGLSVSAGAARIFHLDYQLNPPLAKLRGDVAGEGELPPEVQPSFNRALLDARDCVGRMTTGHVLPRLLVWELVGSRFSADFEKDPAEEGDSALDDGRARCVEAKLASVTRGRVLHRARASADGGENGESGENGDDAGATSFGAIRIQVEPVALPDGPQRAQATTMLGYELTVTAKAGNELVGDTKLRVTPGAVPAIRLRASKVIAEPGDEVTVEILRGPDFQGELPKKLTLVNSDATTAGRIESDVDKKTRAAKFVLPKDKDGWYEARFDQGLARVFVPRRETLFVDVAPDKKIYKPGEKAKLAVKTREKDAGVKAAVGLFGVDSTLGQLAPLAGPGSMDRLASTVDMQHPAFGVLDATALALGRVRGKNAAAATVLLVSNVPSPAELDVSVSASAQTAFNPLLPLADRFYSVLDALYRATRRFEEKAPKDDKITPQKMLELWDEALTDAGKKGVVTDAFGRRLKLHLLPDELIALTDPRLVVADGTRLPEDVEAWIPFVKRSAR